MVSCLTPFVFPSQAYLQYHSFPSETTFTPNVIKPVRNSQHYPVIGSKISPAMSSLSYAGAFQNSTRRM
jgi:Flp pilus assembly secretin CpaC